MKISSIIKVFFILLMSALFSNSIYSQNIIEGYWGVKAGFNENKISNLNLSNSMKPGFHLGAFANFQLNKKLSLQHELLYTMRGVSVQLNDGRKYAKNFSYIDIPWMLNYHLNKYFLISAGIQPSVYAYFKTAKPDTLLYTKDNVNALDFSYLVGATFISSNNFGFGIRFNGS